MFPVIDKFMPANKNKKLESRLMMQRIFQIYMDFMRGIGILDYRVEGGKAINRPGRLVIANHPCLLDIVFLISQIRNATCIVKPGLVANPFMRIPIHAMGYIYADEPEILLEKCARELMSGCSLIVFPEGTRTKPGKPLKFRRGAAAIALRSGAPILPVRMDCSPTTLTKREKWYEIPDRKFILSMQVGDDIEIGPFDGNTSRSRAVRTITRQLEQYFIDRQAQSGKS